MTILLECSVLLGNHKPCHNTTQKLLRNDTEKCDKEVNASLWPPNSPDPGHPWDVREQRPSNPQELKNCRTRPAARHHTTPPECFCPCLDGSEPSLIHVEATAFGWVGPVKGHFNARTRGFPAGHCSVRWSMLFTSLSVCSWNSADFLNGAVLVQEAAWVFH